MLDKIEVPLAGARQQSLRVGRSRTFDEKIVARYPGLFRTGMRLAWRLPRGATKDALFAHYTRRTMYCLGRCDVTLLLTRCSPDVVIHLDAPAEMALEPTYRGHDGVRRALNGLHAALPDPQWVPRERMELTDGRIMQRSTIVVAHRDVLSFTQLLRFDETGMVEEFIWIDKPSDAPASE